MFEVRVLRADSLVSTKGTCDSYVKLKLGDHAKQKSRVFKGTTVSIQFLSALHLYPERRVILRVAHDARA